VLQAIAAFVLVSLAARAYRFRTGVWVPGWTGGIGLLVIFAAFAIIAVALGSPAWIETVFFVVVASVVGAYIQLARTKLPPGRWWEIWR
jgi:hypothetical protein